MFYDIFFNGFSQMVNKVGGDIMLSGSNIAQAWVKGVLAKHHIDLKHILDDVNGDAKCIDMDYGARFKAPGPLSTCLCLAQGSRPSMEALPTCIAISSSNFKVTLRVLATASYPLQAQTIHYRIRSGKVVEAQRMQDRQDSENEHHQGIVVVVGVGAMVSGSVASVTAACLGHHPCLWQSHTTETFCFAIGFMSTGVWGSVWNSDKAGIAKRAMFVAQLGNTGSTNTPWSTDAHTLGARVGESLLRAPLYAQRPHLDFIVISGSGRPQEG
ncbi:hypothetical protein DFP72DRAFT_860097 [Ephemerocybe angulata]|uniref:Uncharacterized protein n=1 Tax=Ephemerocybe angulata TaxID=980116 RepID=A0A8H6HAP1_9AGAR|nr:hypothetical protein DFP72DRAFT_860097 [Tulosesus angulatus]